VRNRALIAVLWRCGLRISEALALELRDVDLDAGTVRVRHGKGDKSRTVGIDEQTAALLARWLDRRKKLSPVRSRRSDARDSRLSHVMHPIRDCMRQPGRNLAAPRPRRRLLEVLTKPRRSHSSHEPKSTLCLSL